MKKLLRNAMMLSAMAGTLFFTSCGEDEVLPTEPSVSVSTTPALNADGDLELSAGEELTITVNATTPNGFNTMRVKIGTTELEQTRTDLGLDATATSATHAFGNLFFSAAGTATIEIEVVDETGATANQSIAVIISSPEVLSYEAVLIGGFLNNTEGSFYDAIADSVFASNTVINNAPNRARIDFVYYYVVGETAVNAVLAAPDNSEAGATWNQQNTDGTWPFTANSNSTRFKPAVQGTNFDFLSTDSDLRAAFGEVGAEDSRQTNLTPGAVIAFRVDDARGTRYGVIEVQSVDGTQGSERSITISVKTQSQDS
jgi:hypothetical protein